MNLKGISYEFLNGIVSKVEGREYGNESLGTGKAENFLIGRNPVVKYFMNQSIIRFLSCSVASL
jgi:hypothetical protein